MPSFPVHAVVWRVWNCVTVLCFVQSASSCSYASAVRRNATHSNAVNGRCSRSGCWQSRVTATPCVSEDDAVAAVAVAGLGEGQFAHVDHLPGCRRFVVTGFGQWPRSIRSGFFSGPWVRPCGPRMNEEEPPSA